MKNKEEKTGVYIVTRQGRRVEGHNYKTEKAAQYRASQLLEMVKEWSPKEKGSISIVFTHNPAKVY